MKSRISGRRERPCQMLLLGQIVLLLHLAVHSFLMTVLSNFGGVGPRGELKERVKTDESFEKFYYKGTKD